MKSLAFPLPIALLALCSALTLNAKNTNRESQIQVGEQPITQVTAKVPVNGDFVTLGTSRIMVSMRLGSPNVVLADGSWVYRNYSAQRDAADPGYTGNLVVRFSRDEVSALTLTDNATVTALRGLPRQPAPLKVLTANQKR